MSIENKIAENQEKILEQSQKVQENIMQCASGARLMESSQVMASSDEMAALMQAIDGSDFSEDDKFLLGKYMGQLLQQDPENGLSMYADYLRGVAQDPAYSERVDLLNSIADQAIDLQNSEAYKTYLQDYHAFEEDESDEAVSARQSMLESSEKMREMLDEESGNA